MWILRFGSAFCQKSSDNGNYLRKTFLRGIFSRWFFLSPMACDRDFGGFVVCRDHYVRNLIISMLHTAVYKYNTCASPIYVTTWQAMEKLGVWNRNAVRQRGEQGSAKGVPGNLPGEGKYRAVDRQNEKIGGDEKRGMRWEFRMVTLHMSFTWVHYTSKQSVAPLRGDVATLTKFA